MPGLNHKQKAFALAYAVGETAGNATQSMIVAGYSPRTAHSAGPRMLQNVDVQALVEKHRTKVVEKAEIKGAAVLKEIAHFAHADPLNVVDAQGRLKQLADIPEETRRAIKSIEIEEIWGPSEPDEKGRTHRAPIGELKKVTFWDKPKGLELLGKNQRLFTDKVEHTVSDSLADLLAAARAGDGE